MRFKSFICIIIFLYFFESDKLYWSYGSGMRSIMYAMVVKRKKGKLTIVIWWEILIFTNQNFTCFFIIILLSYTWQRVCCVAITFLQMHTTCLVSLFMIFIFKSTLFQCRKQFAIDVTPKYYPNYYFECLGTFIGYYIMWSSCWDN